MRETSLSDLAKDQAEARTAWVGIRVDQALGAEIACFRAQFGKKPVAEWLRQVVARAVADEKAKAAKRFG